MNTYSRAPVLRTASFMFLLLCSAGSPAFAATIDCDFGAVRFHSDYAGGRIDGCAQSDSDSYILTLSPENTPVNHSPWYSFRVDADAAKSISVTLRYTEHEHRYVPKLSTDGETWAAIPEPDVELIDGGKKVRLSLTVGPAPLWVSAQEIFDNGDYALWTNQLGQLPFLERTVLGKSVEDRDIYKLETTASGQQKLVVLVGRQHPPEVTGALAMLAFVERVLAEDELAVEFRRQFGMLIVPNLNPDGVYHGNWRHNVQGVDLNRDWGPFTQPETQLMRDELARFLQPGAPRLYLFLDFHSTANDVFYSETPEMTTFPANFTSQWMSAIQRRADSQFPGYKVNWKPGNNPDKPTSKAYAYNTFGIPGITFELGDETDRDFIDAYAAAAAEEMMKNLLETETHSSQ